MSTFFHSKILKSLITRMKTQIRANLTSGLNYNGFSFISAAVPEWFAAGAFGLVTIFTLLLRNVPALQSNLLYVIYLSILMTHIYINKSYVLLKLRVFRLTKNF